MRKELFSQLFSLILQINYSKIYKMAKKELKKDQNL